MNRTAMNPRATALAALGLALVTTAAAHPLATAQPQSPAAPKAAATPVALINGDASLPAFTGTDASKVSVTGWSVGSTNGAGTTDGVWRYGPEASGHPDGKVGVMLRGSGADTYGFKQRLRGVRPGAKVTVTWDDSPGVAKECRPRDVELGQMYSVQGSGGPARVELTEPDPDKETNTLGAGVWRTKRTYTFTADEYDPLLTFASTMSASKTNSSQCGAMIADIKATEIAPALDKTVRSNEMPESVAYKGNDKRPVSEAVTECVKNASQCVFAPEDAYSFPYYEPARQNGESYVNCTRSTLNRTRPLKFSARTISDLPPAAGLPPAPGGEPTAMTAQYAGGTGSTPAWFPTTERTVNEVIKPAEVSWFETQGGRQRTEGWFLSNPTPTDPNQDWRLHTVIDHPAPGVSDRVFQRTGPMSAAEEARCRANRPTADTPNDAASPAAGADRD
ncbi:hypothetical protein AB0E83_09165 [Streptomyces sp. NPDC035033]|uniref:hypothetical protein n=1 Tax=Streptomyces sp. NPDC035033 TaxID=3155368 RepID=UPI0033FBA8C8